MILKPILFTSVIFGDWNLPGVDWENPLHATGSIKSNDLIQFCLDLGFAQLNRFPTRGASILDLVLCNDPLIVSSINVGVPFGSSDHASLCVCKIVKSIN